MNIYCMCIRFPIMILALLLTFLLSGTAMGTPPTYAPFTLTFQDEFSAPLDTNTWEILSSDGSWLLSSRGPENIEVSDGNLILKTLLTTDPEDTHDWSTGHIRTQMTQKYGYFEARLKYADHPWLNNAFWLFGEGTVGAIGNKLEVDINEGRAPNEITQNYHIHPDIVQSLKLYPNENLADSWHTYGVEWGPRQLIYYYDDQIVNIVHLYTASFYPRDIRFSTAILQGLVERNLDETRDPAGYHMEIDYVKVWQRNDNYTNSGQYSSTYQTREAEDYDEAFIGIEAAASSDWEEAIEGSRTFMQAAPNNGVNTYDGSNGPFLRNYFWISENIRLYPKVVMAGATSTDDSIHIAFNEELITTGMYGMYPTNVNTWSWVKDVPGRVPQPRVYIDVPYAGWHSVDILMREDGVKVDRFILSTVP